MNWIKKCTESVKTLVDGRDKKRLIENAVIIIIIGIIIIIAGSSLFKSNSKKPNNTSQPGSSAALVAGRSTSEGASASMDKQDVKAEIESILSQIDGVGKVNVMITYYSGKELVPAYDSTKKENVTQEKDSGGGTRSISDSENENKVVFEDSQGGGKTPIFVKELLPAVKGVVVVAEGASSAEIREKLCKAVQALLDIPLYRIQVFERKK